MVTVKSESSDEEYEVDAVAGTCTCPHYTKRLKEENEKDGGARVCKHVKRLRDKAVGHAH